MAPQVAIGLQLMQLVEGGLLLAGTDVVDDLFPVAEEIILVAFVNDGLLAAGARLARQPPQQVVLVLHQVGVHPPARLLHRLGDGRPQADSAGGSQEGLCRYEESEEKADRTPMLHGMDYLVGALPRLTTHPASMQNGNRTRRAQHEAKGPGLDLSTPTALGHRAEAGLRASTEKNARCRSFPLCVIW